MPTPRHRRITLEAWTDDDLIGSGLTVRYSPRFAYLRPLLRTDLTGTELSIIGDPANPELIIVAPDLLVDVTTITSCIAPYAEGPLVAVVNRLSERELTEDILMGQMAGQLLDEELHSPNKSYAESATDFFANNAMAVVGAQPRPIFHEQARRQKSIIHHAISQQLPSLHPAFRREDVVVEPSFVCPMLGLQGRMDFLQLDLSLVIEQKSGRAGWVRYDATPAVPKPRDEHQAQMQLYAAILHYAHEADPQAYLLYSKYDEPLQPLLHDPNLLLRAIALRNMLAVQELRLATDGYDFLHLMRAEDFRTKSVSDSLWTGYIEPRLNRLLGDIKTASTLERAYWSRMLRFVATEHLTAKRTFAGLWQKTLAENAEDGDVLHGLFFSDFDSPVLRLSGQLSEATNLRIGDIVIVYPYDTEPNIDAEIVYRGTIASLSNAEVSVRLRNGQTDDRLFRTHTGRLWAVEHDFMSSSFASLYSGVQAFLSAPKRRRDLLLTQSDPSIDTTLMLRGSYGDFDEMQLRVKQARDIFLIIGPPGTGKTSFGMLHTLQEELLETDGSVAVMAYTNRAVDEICSKLATEGIDFLRLGSPLSCAPAYRSHLVAHRSKEHKRASDLRAMICQARVVVGTVAAFQSSTVLRQVRRFSLAIVDEASQILEPHLVGLWSAIAADGMPSFGRFVFIGDHKQLPAVVAQSKEESRVSEPQLQAIGLTDCRLSLFERLLLRWGHDPSVTYMLTRQGRMHEDIQRLASEAFYGGQLSAVPLAHQRGELSGWISRIRFVDVPAEPSQSKCNAAEAQAIASLAEEIYRTTPTFDAATSLGIIVPYRSQIAAVRSAIERLGIEPLQAVTIDTVERFQGSQRRTIIYGFTATTPTHLAFLTETTFEEDGQTIDRKLNVALTRAMDRLILVGNRRLLATVPLYKRLIDSI